MPIFNLLEYSDNNSMTSRSLSNYYKDEINDHAGENNAADNRINNNNAITNPEVVAPLKYLSNF